MTNTKLSYRQCLLEYLKKGDSESSVSICSMIPVKNIEETFIELPPNDVINLIGSLIKASNETDSEILKKRYGESMYGIMLGNPALLNQEISVRECFLSRATYFDELGIDTVISCKFKELLLKIMCIST